MQEDQISVLCHSPRLPTCLAGCTELTTVISETVTASAPNLIRETRQGTDPLDIGGKENMGRISPSAIKMLSKWLTFFR